VNGFFKIRWVVLGLVSLVIFQMGCEKKAEEKKGYEILTKTTEKMNICYLAHMGPYKHVGSLLAKLSEYAAQKRISGEMLGIYYDDPAKVPAESLRSDIGIVVPEGFKPDSGYYVKEIPPRKVVYAILKGPYAEIAKEYPKIFKWIEEKGYKISGPLMEIYLEAGPDVPPEQLVTEVQIPIE